QDVALLAVRIGEERDPRRTVRVVFDRRHLRRNVVLVALEVDGAVHPLVATAAPPRRQVSAVVSAAGTVQRLDERFVRLRRGELVEHLDGLEPCPRRRRIEFANRHVKNPLTSSSLPPVPHPRGLALRRLRRSRGPRRRAPAYTFHVPP